jgi:O-antigen/teichoic acid export membrane protein
MTQAKATAEGYLWNHAGKILEYLLLFLITVLLARGLGVEANGVFASLVSFAQLLVVLSSLSLESSLNRFIPQLEAIGSADGKARLRFMLRRVLLARAILLATIVAIAFLVVQLSGTALPAAATRYFWLLAGYAGVRSFVQLLSMVFVAQLRTAPLARIAVVVRIIELAGIAGMLTSGMTIPAVMVFLIATGVLQVSTCLFIARSDFAGEVQPHPLRPLYAFGAMYWTNTILDYFLGRQGDVLFLTILLPSPVPASMYNVAFSVVLVASQGLTLGLAGITLTSFSRLAVTSPDTMNRFYGFLVRLVTIMVLPVLVFISFNAGPITTILFSNDFAAAAFLVQVMITFRVVARLFAGSENAEYLLARGNTLRVVQIGVIGAATNVVLDLLLIPQYLAFGAVIGSGCANLVVNILGSLAVRTSAGSPVIQWRYWGLITVSSVVAGFITSSILPGSSWVLLLGRGAVFAGLTGLFLFLTKPFPARDVEWVREVHHGVARVFSRFTKESAGTLMQVS